MAYSFKDYFLQSPDPRSKGPATPNEEPPSCGTTTEFSHLRIQKIPLVICQKYYRNQIHFIYGIFLSQILYRLPFRLRYLIHHCLLPDPKILFLSRRPYACLQYSSRNNLGRMI